MTDTVRYIGGRPLVWSGHQVERTFNPDANPHPQHTHRTLCGLIPPEGGVYLSCDPSPYTCMECALVLDAEIEALDTETAIASP
jgi:hypothetical protein